MTKFSNKLKKPCFGTFWTLFPNFGVKKNLPKNPALSRTTSFEFLAPCQISEKANDAIPRKRLDRRTNGRTEGRKDGQTLFYKTLPATTGVPINGCILY